jgi:large subunit ribosomal protein L19
MEWLKLIHGTTKQSAPATLGPGAEVRVWYRILEHGKERLGQFEGVVIRCRGSGFSKTFTVRRVTHGEGVERVFPSDSQTISRIDVLQRRKVRRSRLYFLRTAVGKTRIASVDASATPEKVENADSITPHA